MTTVDTFEFVCSACQGSVIEVIMGGGTSSTPLISLGTEGCEKGSVLYEYGEPNIEEGHVERYQCQNCGFVILGDGVAFDEFTQDGLGEQALVRFLYRTRDADTPRKPSLLRISPTAVSRPIEMGRCFMPDRWDTVIVQIPVDTPEDKIHEVAQAEVCRETDKESHMAGCFVYNTMDDYEPDEETDDK